MYLPRLASYHTVRAYASSVKLTRLAPYVKFPVNAVEEDAANRAEKGEWYHLPCDGKKPPDKLFDDLRFVFWGERLIGMRNVMAARNSSVEIANDIVERTNKCLKEAEAAINKLPDESWVNQQVSSQLNTASFARAIDERVSNVLIPQLLKAIKTDPQLRKAIRDVLDESDK